MRAKPNGASSWSAASGPRNRAQRRTRMPMSDYVLNTRILQIIAATSAGPARESQTSSGPLAPWHDRREIAPHRPPG